MVMSSNSESVCLLSIPVDSSVLVHSSVQLNLGSTRKFPSTLLFYE